MNAGIRSGIREIMPCIWFFPLTLCYYESIFRGSTSGGLWQLSLLTMLLFSAAYGLLLALPVCLIRSSKVQRGVTAAVLFLTALPYIVEYFVYAQFKVFYDLNTVFGGAGGVVTGFSRDIFRLVFSPGGLVRIVLFLLPLVLFLLLSRRARPASGRHSLAVAVLMAVCFGSGLLMTFLHPVYRAVWGPEYSFQQAVGTFGLYTGIGLDVQHLLSGGNSFETPEALPAAAELPAAEAPDAPAPQAAPAEITEAPVTYGFNQLALDFQKPSDSAQIADLNQYVQSLTPSRKNQYTGLFKGKNLIMISAEAFSHKVIDPQLTPTLYRLANRGIRFTDYYQPSSAGTTGGEYQNLMGLLPTAGGMSMKNTSDHLNATTISWHLDQLGYFGMAFHNNTYTYYDRDKTHTNLNFSNGYMGYGNGMEEFITNQWPQSDLEMIEGTLPLYIDHQPFDVYYMSVSGHCGYSRSQNAMVSKNWDKVKDLPCSDPVKGYLAANLELEYALQHLVEQLEAKGIADDTVICLTADHFPYGLDENGGFGNMPRLEELYGTPVRDYFDRDRNALILWSGCLEQMEPITVDAPAFSLDILPTLSNLFGVEFDSRLLPGRDVFSDAPPLIFNAGYDWKTDLGTYTASSGTFTPAPGMENSIPEDYVSSIKTAVRNKIRYCKLVLDTDYYRYLFE